jgi:phosphorylcholine metabolism protein LicD
MNEYAAIQTLMEAKTILDKYHLEYWLDAGTLLGAVRDGKFIPWDEDIDLGTWYENSLKLISISSELRKNGFNTFFEEYEFIMEKNGCKLEILLYHLIDGKATYVLFLNRNLLGSYLGSLHSRLTRNIISNNNEDYIYPRANLKRPIIKVINMFPTAMKQKLDRLCVFFYKKIGLKFIVLHINAKHFNNFLQINFYGMTFNAPKNINKYLIIRYGEKWRVPDINWKYYKDIPALALKR